MDAAEGSFPVLVTSKYRTVFTFQNIFINYLLTFWTSLLFINFLNIPPNELLHLLIMWFFSNWLLFLLMYLVLSIIVYDFLIIW